MPIRNYHVVGDFKSKCGSFFKDDVWNKLDKSPELFNNVKAINKIKRIWKRVPYDFNFNFVNFNDGIRFKEGFFNTVGVHTIDQVKNFKICEKYIGDLKLDFDAINVIFKDNFTSYTNYMPMTAWIMAHRTEHAILSNSRNNTVVNEYYGNIVNDIAKVLNSTIKKFNRDSRISFKSDNNALILNDITEIDNEMLNALIKSMLTMRSARMGLLTNTLDIIAELTAQWLLTGSIRVNDISNIITTNDYINLRGACCCKSKKIRTYMISKQNVIELNVQWQKLVIDLDMYYNKLFRELIGKVLVF